MKGFFPFVRELLFGPPKLKCTKYGCRGNQAPYCYGGLCPQHCDSIIACQCLKNQDRQIRAVNRKESVETIDQEFGAF